MVASLTDIEDSIEIGSLSAACQYRSYSALKRCNLLCHRIVGGIGEARVEIALVLEVEKAGHLLARVVFECCALVDRQLLWLALAWFPSAVNADGLDVFLHYFSLLLLLSIQVTICKFTYYY